MYQHWAWTLVSGPLISLTVSSEGKIRFLGMPAVAVAVAVNSHSHLIHYIVVGT
jgi:hypothetical protein